MVKFILAIVLSFWTINLFSEDIIQTVKQPLFLICPHTEGSSALSLYAIVDSKDSSKLIGVGIEQLIGKNSKDNKYEDVVIAQSDIKTNREKVSEITIENFGKHQINFNDILRFNLSIDKDGGYNVEINSRVSVEGYFQVGAFESNRRKIALEYSTLYKVWRLSTSIFVNSNGENIIGKFPKVLTGLRFSASSTMVYKIMLIDEFKNVYTIYDYETK